MGGGGGERMVKLGIMLVVKQIYPIISNIACKGISTYNNEPLSKEDIKKKTYSCEFLLLADMDIVSCDVVCTKEYAGVLVAVYSTVM